MATLETTGQLRALLAGTIVDVREARIEIGRATAIVKLASEINNSMIAEVAAARIRMQQNLSVPDTGGLRIGDELRPLNLRAPAKMIRGKVEEE